ncbi:MAG TPA: hypothetical protein V6D17_21860 [Candidatus Obscuribacterales bacterium]
MDFWAIILVVAFMTGIMGWGMSVFTNAVYWYCEWREGNDINWGSEAFYSFAMPFAWLYSIFVIVVLYCR